MRIDDYYDIAFSHFRGDSLSLSPSLPLSLYLNLNDCLICAHLWAVKAAGNIKWLLLLKELGGSNICKLWHLTSGGSP